MSDRDEMNSMYNKLTLNNPGAITVMISLFDDENISVSDRYAFIRRCEDIHLVGGKMWVGYKFSKFNISTFCNKVLQNDNVMIRHINEMVDNGGCSGQHVLIDVEYDE